MKSIRQRVVAVLTRDRTVISVRRARVQQGTALMLAVWGCLNSMTAGESVSTGMQQTTVRILSGKAASAALEEKTSWSADGASLQSTLDQWQLQSGVRLIRDRRLNPDQIVNFSPESGSRARMLDSLVAALPGTDWVLTEDCAYVGPSTAALRLPLLMEQQRKLLQTLRSTLDPSQTSRLTVRLPSRWEQLASPREIVSTAAREAGLILENPDVIPHDVWAADVWPDMTFGEQATLILNQFDLMLQLSDETGHVRVTAVDWSLPVDFTLAFPPDQKQVIDAAAAREVPSVSVRWSRGNARVSGPLRDLLWFQRRFNAIRRGVDQADGLTESLKTRLFTLTVERATLATVVAGFEQNGIVVQLTDVNSQTVQAVLQKSVTIRAVRQPGQVFFAEVFGEYFENIKVLDDKVVLTGPK